MKACLGYFLRRLDSVVQLTAGWVVTQPTNIDGKQIRTVTLLHELQTTHLGNSKKKINTTLFLKKQTFLGKSLGGICSLKENVWQTARSGPTQSTDQSVLFRRQHYHASSVNKHYRSSLLNTSTLQQDSKLFHHISTAVQIKTCFCVPRLLLTHWSGNKWKIQEIKRIGSELYAHPICMAKPHLAWL